MIEPKLIILTTHFGKNFSGGSKATCEIFERIQYSFSQVIVVCNATGDHSFDRIEFQIFRNQFELLKILLELRSEKAVFYGDFYNSIYYVILGIPFYFTYHDNWPEASKINFKNAIKAFFYIPVYKWIFKRSRGVIAVSIFKKNMIDRYNPSVHLIRNGVSIYDNTHQAKQKSNSNIIMVGNIDHRKYGKALGLFSHFNSPSFSIDIYGNILDQRLSAKLDAFPFTHILHHQKSIPFSNYSLLLHTSMIENMPMAICEAIISGIPVIAFNVGGIREIIKNNRNGILIPPYDIQQMYHEIENVLIRKVSIPMDKTYLSKFNWDETAKKYKHVLLNK